MSGSFEEEEDDADDSFTDGLAPPVDGAPTLSVGEPAEEEVWDEADFDEDFDEDFENEPDEDLEKFERELDSENIEQQAEPDEFDEEDF